MLQEKTIFRSYNNEAEEELHDYFDMNVCYDYRDKFDCNRLQDAIMDGEYVHED